jgi:hypothetical protein
MFNLNLRLGIRDLDQPPPFHMVSISHYPAMRPAILAAHEGADIEQAAEALAAGIRSI